MTTALIFGDRRIQGRESLLGALKELRGYANKIVTAEYVEWGKIKEVTGPLTIIDPLAIGVGEQVIFFAGKSKALMYLSCEGRPLFDNRHNVTEHYAGGIKALRRASFGFAEWRDIRRK